MASTKASSRPAQPSFVLTFEPPKFSISAGTAFEVPAEELERLHRNTEPFPELKDLPGSFPSDADQTGKNGAAGAKSRRDSLQPGAQPELARPQPQQQQQYDPHGAEGDKPRKLFSLRSLRNSFSSSRASLNIPRPSSDYQHSRPVSPGPSIMSSFGGAPPPQQHQPPTLRSKRSSSWFNRRRSGFFQTNEDGMLDVVSEDPATEAGARDSKRMMKARDPNIPSLPEVSTLKGGKLDDGGLGWDEGMFKA